MMMMTYWTVCYLTMTMTIMMTVVVRVMVILDQCYCKARIRGSALFLISGQIRLLQLQVLCGRGG